MSNNNWNLIRSTLFYGVAALSVWAASGAGTNEVADLGTILVEGSALSKYRPATVNGATFTDLAPEKSPTVVDTLTEDFIRDHNPTDLNDLLSHVPGVDTGGTSLLVRQPGVFSIRGMGGAEPAFDGVVPVGSGPGLFIDPYLMERVEIVKGPLAALSGGAGASMNNNGAGGSVNLYLKGAQLERDVTKLQENTSVGRNTWRERGMVDSNQLVSEKIAVRAIGSFDLYSPVYTSYGSQEGAAPRQSYSLAPSFVAKPNDEVTFGLKTLFQTCDQPSYIGVPVWKGEPAGGYGWYESSCDSGDRTKYQSMMINPYLDWQVTEAWLLKFGGSFLLTTWEQQTREPYCQMRGAEFENFCKTGEWSSGQKYMTSGFSESSSVQRNYFVYGRSVWTEKELPYGFSNSLLVQPDFYWRERDGSAPVSRYGATAQEQVGWGWVTLLGGLRYDFFTEYAKTTDVGVHTCEAREYAFSPRGGLTVKPLEWLVFFGNVSQTKTPTFGYRGTGYDRPADPWTATQLEGGVRVRPLEKLWLSASYYAIDQKNAPVAVDNVGTAYYFEGENKSEGVELSLTGDVTENWTVMALYAYNHYKNCRTAHNDPTRSCFERNPRHTLTLNTSYRFDCCDLLRDIVIGGGYRFRSKSYACVRGQFQDENLYFKPSHVFDINLSIPFEKFGGPEDWYLTLGVKNLFDEKYFNTSRHFYECFVGDPRTFEIGLTAEF